MSTERDTTRLPKWAQDRIERLERDLAAATQRLAVGPEDSDTIADPFMDKRPLGRSTRVRFYVDKHERDYVDVWTTDDGEVNVNASDGLLIGPRASNSLVLAVENPVARRVRDRKAGE